MPAAAGNAKRPTDTEPQSPPALASKILVMPHNEHLRQELLAMRAEDLRVREEVIKGASIFDGYHPRMEEVHMRHAARLKEIIAAHGWPGRSLVAEDGAFAAWFIAQHAISDPPFQRRCLVLLHEAHAKGEVPAAQPAFLEDRICYFKGRPQIYGTQFEPDENGLLQPYLLADPEQVNARRRAIGLNTLEERTHEMRAGQQPEPNPKEARVEYERKYQQWLRKVGWRS
jgi:hypothetical protein